MGQLVMLALSPIEMRRDKVGSGPRTRSGRRDLILRTSAIVGCRLHWDVGPLDTSLCPTSHVIAHDVASDRDCDAVRRDRSDQKSHAGRDLLAGCVAIAADQCPGLGMAGFGQRPLLGLSEYAWGAGLRRDIRCRTSP